MNIELRVRSILWNDIRHLQFYECRDKTFNFYFLKISIIFSFECLRSYFSIEITIMKSQNEKHAKVVEFKIIDVSWFKFRQLICSFDEIEFKEREQRESRFNATFVVAKIVNFYADLVDRYSFTFRNFFDSSKMTVYSRKMTARVLKLRRNDSAWLIIRDDRFF